MNVLTLRAARVNAGISVKAAANAVGVSEDTMYRYEVGKSSPNIGVAVKLAELYGTTIDKIDFIGSAKTDE